MQRQRTSTIHTHARPSAVVQHYNHIRSHATRLYEVFQDTFNTCRASHNRTHSASLRLSRAIPHRTGESDLSLTVLFDFDEASGTLPWDWREIYFMPIDRRRHGQRVSEEVRGRGGGFASGLDSVNERVSPAGRRSRIGKAIVTADVGLIGGSETRRIT